jgi:TonB family protein
VLGHVALVGIIARQVQLAPPVPAEDEALWAEATAAAASPTWVDLRSVADLAAPQPEPSQVLPAADQARSVTAESAPRLGATEERTNPAADTGDGTGRPSVLAFRRDRSTLRARVADSAGAYQIERERTARAASSPQPLRQEPRVGTGDSSRNRRRRPADAVAASQTLPADPDGLFDPQPTAPEGRSQQSDTGADLARGDGPLDAEQGRRRFDVSQAGIAQDAQSVRGASNEAHPGHFELSSPAAVGAGTAGHGPGADPGVVSRPAPGNAAAVRGAPGDAPRGPDLAMSAAEREYHRALLEIQRRVSKTLRFPKRLALELEQGETVVYFVLRPDGRIDGTVRILKSAGFDEFDAEAVSAVTRAAPFPAMHRQFSISMPISFDNPLVR